MLKVALFFLAVIAVALFAADQVAQNTAEKRLEERLASSISSAEGVEVDVGGGLFLPQLVTGGLSEVTVSLDSIEREGLVVDEVKVRLRDIAFSLSDLLGGEGAVSVAGGRGRAVISESSVQRAIIREGVPVQVDLSGGGSLSARGVTAQVEKVSVGDDTVVFEAPPLEPLQLDLPETLTSVSYSGVTVRGGRLVLRLAVTKGKLDL